MNLKISKQVGALFAHGRGDDETNDLEAYGLDTGHFNYGAKEGRLALAKMGPKKLAALQALLETKADSHGKLVKPLIRDVAAWIGSMAKPDSAKGRSVEQAAQILRQFLLKHVPGQRVFESNRDNPGTWLCYYIGGVIYHPPSKGRGDDYTPPSISLKAFYEERGIRHATTFHLTAEQCQGKTAADILRTEDLVPETAELRDRYLKERDLFSQIFPGVGAVFTATGIGSLNEVDGNPEDQDLHGFHRARWESDLDMEKGGQASRVVIDVFHETDRKNQNREGDQPDPAYWQRVKDGEQDLDDEGDDWEADDDVEISPVEVPVHPYLIVFDLTRHLRVSVHVNQVRPYKFDTKLADKLVLDQQRKELVKLLVETKAGGFTDIVRGKAGGAVVLLVGPPGTGKTLTAEVYAESERRALYSVQCSQLGIDVDDLEAELLKVFDRARRWNAVLLVDEADVYVRQRSNDLMQNAIVGVFLRVLEYQSTVMFLTSNRPDDIDDAIASRCIAKLTYRTPNEDEQARIWGVLTAAQGITMTDDVIDQIVDQNRGLTGRDIKNLIKLAQMRGAITPESIKFVKQFKPTGDYSQEGK